ncbi:MAG: aldehyde ferredoxin oxidoreductase family protein [Candidatus Bipolaricaulota bacterium]
MKSPGGYWKRVLEVDLSEQETQERELSEDFLNKYIGGAGFTTKFLYDQVDSDTDPLGPDNVLSVAPGLLVGPKVPTGSKTTFGFKSPQTGGYGKSLVGAKMGDALKRAGYDALTVRGKAKSPCLLLISDQEIKIESAKDLWGLNNRATDAKIKENYGDVSTATIGPAGENLSRIAMIECEDRQAGKGGGGAVMGSKNLKAIAVRGTKEPPVHDWDKLNQLNEKWRKITTGQGESGDVSFDPQDAMEYGTGEAMHAKNNFFGCFPTKNWQAGYFKKAYDRVSGPEGRIELDPRYWTKEYREGRRSCPYCTKPCSQFFVAENSPYGDIEVDGPEYETLYSFGGACEVDDVEAVARANELCDELGMDTISAGITIAWAMESHEKGLLSTDLNLRFGNAEAMLEAVKRMGHKQGELGELLGNGVEEAADRLGQGSDQWAIHVKGMPPAGFEVRALRGMALAFAVAPRGADHLTSCLYALEMAGDFWNFENVDRKKIEGKAGPLKAMEDLMTLYDMTGICKFSRGLMFEDGLLELTNALTGFDFTRPELMESGERVYNLSRAINIREGFGKKQDTLPDRVFEDPVLYGPTEGETLSRAKFLRELERYYTRRGWDEEGVPLPNTLERLGIPELSQELNLNE